MHPSWNIHTFSRTETSGCRLFSVFAGRQFLAPSHCTLSYVHSDEHIWEDALLQPIDTGIEQIDLRYHRFFLASPAFIISEQQSTTQVYMMYRLPSAIWQGFTTRPSCLSRPLFGTDAGVHQHCTQSRVRALAFLRTNAVDQGFWERSTRPEAPLPYGIKFSSLLPSSSL
jgi:hypothetical protein